MDDKDMQNSRFKNSNPNRPESELCDSKMVFKEENLQAEDLQIESSISDLPFNQDVNMESSVSEEFIIPDYVETQESYNNYNLPIKTEPKEEVESETEIEFTQGQSSGNKFHPFSMISGHHPLVIKNCHSTVTEEISNDFSLEMNCEDSSTICSKDSLEEQEYMQPKTDLKFQLQEGVPTKPMTADEEAFQVDNDDKCYNYEMSINPEDVNGQHDEIAVSHSSLKPFEKYSEIKRNISSNFNFTCMHCSRVFVTKDTGQVPDFCCYCGESFPKNLPEHSNSKGKLLQRSVDKKAVPENSNASNLDACTTKTNCVTHSAPKPHQCNYCNRKFTTRYFLTKHLKLCSLGKVDPEQLFSYKKSAHPTILKSLAGEKFFKCTKCEKIFTCKSEFTTHPCQQHPETSPKYSDADNAFVMNTLQAHSREEKSLKCRYCGMIFYSRHNLSKHIKLHPNVNLHKCGYCDKAFSSNGLLNRHLNVHPEAKLLKCTFCEQKFATHSNLERHLKWHPQGKRSRTKRTYYDQNDWNKNLIMLVSLTGEKFHKCGKCEKVFSFKSDFSNHACAATVNCITKYD